MKSLAMPVWHLQDFLSQAKVTFSRTMFARIGVTRALNRHVEREFNPDRKNTHWGKRKLKRDE